MVLPSSKSPPSSDNCLVRRFPGKPAQDPATVISRALDARCQREQGLLHVSKAADSSSRMETTQKPSGFILLVALTFPSL